MSAHAEKGAPLLVLHFNVAEADIDETIATAIGKDRNAFCRHVCQTWQAVRIGIPIIKKFRTERVPVIARGDLEFCRRNAVARFICGVCDRAIKPELAIEPHAIVHVVIEESEHVETIAIGNDCPLISAIET